MPRDDPRPPAPALSATSSPSATTAPAAPTSPSAPSSPAPPPLKGPYLFNLLLLVIVCTTAVVFFKVHLEPYFDQVALVGGTLSFWASLKIAWTVFEKSSKADAWELSRRWMSLTDIRIVLLALLLALVVLWCTTSSQYFEYNGPGLSSVSLTVHVLKDDATNRARPLAERESFAADAVLAPNERLQGRGFFWQFGARPLLCVLEKKGVPYEPLDCSIQPGSSTRLQVPGGFRLKKMHLVRLIPSIDAFTMLPNPEAERQSVFYRLTLEADSAVQKINDLRLGVLLLGGQADEMDELRAMQSDDELALNIRNMLLAKGIFAESAARATAILTRHQTLHGLRLSEGQALTILLEKVTVVGDQESVAPVPGYPLRVVITSDKVQSIWLPGN